VSTLYVFHLDINLEGFVQGVPCVCGLCGSVVLSVPCVCGGVVPYVSPVYVEGLSRMGPLSMWRGCPVCVP